MWKVERKISPLNDFYEIEFMLKYCGMIDKPKKFKIQTLLFKLLDNKAINLINEIITEGVSSCILNVSTT